MRDTVTSLESDKNNQRKELIKYMNNHTYVATNQISKLGETGKDNCERIWSKCTKYLNILGPDFKSPEEWKQVKIKFILSQ